VGDLDGDGVGDFLVGSPFATNPGFAAGPGEHGLAYLYSFNDEYSGIEPARKQKLYGSEDPRLQHTWEYYAENYPQPMRFYANIFDLANDSTGDFRVAREAQNARTGEPLEGLQMVVIASGLLSDADRAEFEERLKEYPGF
jgi:hypothetical protein